MNHLLKLLLFTLTTFVLGQNSSSCPVCPSIFSCKTTPCQNFGVCDSVLNTCSCPSGWGGNTCLTPLCDSLIKSNLTRTQSPNNLGCIKSQCSGNWTGQNCNTCMNNEVCSSLGVIGTDEICNQTPVVWANSYYGFCTVSNSLLASLVGTRVINATIQKDQIGKSLFASIFIDNSLQFSCTAGECSQTFPSDLSSAVWSCGSTLCECNPGSFACGGGAAIDLTSYINAAKGSFDLTSSNTTNYNLKASFLTSLFPKGIDLVQCGGGECVRADASPAPPPAVADTVNPIGIGAIVVLVSLICGGFGLWVWAYLEREKLKKLPPPADINGCSLKYEDIRYRIKEKEILFGVTGEVRAGQFLAIMGPSGSGKTTFLDILAKKTKAGQVSGKVLLNGEEVNNLSQFKKMTGYVDQEDIHIPSLTVRETLEFSAAVRLPESLDATMRKYRVESVMKQLGLSHVAESRVGDASKRGLSGGEKKRLSIAVELVTNPAILFVDEPTSGLDSFSALQTIRTLATLATESKKTIVCTVHQPNSAIFSLFDNVLLLAKGKAVYLGPASKSEDFCKSIGFPCPPHYHIADHLLDVAVAVGAGEKGEVTTPEVVDAEHRPSKRLSFFRKSTEGSEVGGPIIQPPAVIVAPGTSMLTQVEQVMKRSLKVFRRHPVLFYAHVGLSIFVGIFVGIVYFHVDNSLAGLQNRLGSFFFMQSLLAFGGLSAISSVASDRLLFIRERSNGMYGYFPYFLSKMCFDLVPLRILPAILMCAIAYFLVGFVPMAGNFFKFMLVMVLFNVNAGLHGFIIACMIPETSTSTLVAVMSLLFQMLFSGVLVNAVTMPAYIGWIQYFSFFKYAYEACIANEATGLYLEASISGINVQIPAQTILDAFGLDGGAYYRDLAVTLGLAILLSILIALLINIRLRERK